MVCACRQRSPRRGDRKAAVIAEKVYQKQADPPNGIARGPSTSYAGCYQPQMFPSLRPSIGIHLAANEVC